MGESDAKLDQLSDSQAENFRAIMQEIEAQREFTIACIRQVSGLLDRIVSNRRILVKEIRRLRLKYLRVAAQNMRLRERLQAENDLDVAAVSRLLSDAASPAEESAPELARAHEQEATDG